MDVFLVPLFKLIINLIGLYMWIVVIGVILSWLTAFNVINASNRFVYLVGDFVYRITEPALRQSFLERVAVNRQIVAAYEKLIREE